MNSFYLPASGQVYFAPELQQNTGFSPDTDPGVLAANGIYTVIYEACPYDLGLYQPTPAYTIVGDYAQETWTATPYPLAVAKDSGSYEAKTAANAEVNLLECECGFSNDLLTAVSSQDPLARPARYQAELDEMVAISNQLDADLTAIDSATTVDEINNIVNKPTGILFTGRGAGLGPEDLNVSYYNAFNSVSMTESETELYVPGTDTVIAYGSGGAGKFDSLGNCFNPGDYELQIRQASTGRVIATFECPLAPAGTDVTF